MKLPILRLSVWLKMNGFLYGIGTPTDMGGYVKASFAMETVEGVYLNLLFFFSFLMQETAAGRLRWWCRLCHLLRNEHQYTIINLRLFCLHLTKNAFVIILSYFISVSVRLYLVIQECFFLKNLNNSQLINKSPTMDEIAHINPIIYQQMLRYNT